VKRTIRFAIAAVILLTACGPNREAVGEYSKIYNQGLEFYTKRLYDKAEPLLKEALDKGTSLYGADYCELAGIRDNSDPSAPVTYPGSLYAELALTYEKQGKTAQAEPLRRKDLELHGKYLGEWGRGGDIDERDINAAIIALADNLLAQNKLDEAEKLYKRSIEVQEHNSSENLKRQTKGLMWCKEHAGLAEVYRRKGDSGKSEDYFKRAIQGMESFNDQSKLSETKLNFAKLLKATGRGAQGAQMERSVEESRKNAEEFGR
jgi:tetratricopeptide (TPR) repeat protein